MKIIISIIILALVILCLYFVLKSTENFYVDVLNDTEQEIFDTIEEMASLLYENPKVLSYAKYVGFNVNNEAKDERNDYDLNSIKDLAQRITDSYRSGYFVFTTGDPEDSYNPEDSAKEEGVTHLNPKYYLHSNSEFNFNRQWLAPGWWEKHKPGFGNDSNTNHHPQESYHRGSSEGIGAERIYEEHPDKYECNEAEWSKQGWYMVPNEDVDAFNNKNCMYIHILSPYRTAYDAIVARQSDGAEVGALGDMVAAFVDDEQRGVGVASEVPVFLGNGYAFLMMVYSNATGGETMTFQYYDSVEDAVYNTSETLDFTVNMVEGDVTNPFALNYTPGSGDGDGTGKLSGMEINISAIFASLISY